MREGMGAPQLFDVEAAKAFLEQFCLHLLVEVTAVSLIDQVVMNTALSMVLGVGLVEGVRVLWRGWRRRR
ncbi:hypothetical protein JXL21_04500 [Candidatus Bathyarchaeota archaeon]|nr:hypothetical protein [Candidatus Bathyarchaeota archaeon]